MPSRKPKPRPVCGSCGVSFDPQSATAGCKCPSKMQGTYRVETSRGIVERKYGHASGNHQEEE